MSTTPRISNIYAILGLTPQASAQDIANAIAAKRQSGEVNAVILDKAGAWLLNENTRAQYDQKLQEQAPQLFQAASVTQMALAIEPEPSKLEDKRLGVLSQDTYMGRQDVRIEPDVELDDHYSSSHQRHNWLSKVIIYGTLAAFVLGIILLFAWPYLQRTMFAPSEWDKIEFRQNLVQQGWREDEQAEYAYLSGQEYDSRLAIVFEKNVAMAVLVNTGCDMTPQGLCDIKVTVDGDAFEFDGTVGVGLRDTIPLTTRAHQDDLVDALQQAHRVSVTVYSNNKATTHSFSPE